MKGMQKIKRGKGFRGVLAYAMEKDQGKIIGGNMIGSTINELAKEFRISEKIRQDIEKPVWHNSLRLPKNESLADDKWQEIANSYMKKMGFSDMHQRIYVKHSDPAGEHIHIVASRISLDGGLMYLGQNENLKSTRHIQDLEKEFGLTITKGPSPSDGKKTKPKKQEIEMAIRTDKAPPRLVLQQIVDEAIKDKPSIFEFIDRLELSGVGVKPAVAKTGRMNGFSFEFGGVAFKASQLGKDYGWKKLSESVIYEQARDSEKLIAIANRAGDRENQDDGGYGGIDRGNEHQSRISERRAVAVDNEIDSGAARNKESDVGRREEYQGGYAGEQERERWTNKQIDGNERGGRAGDQQNKEGIRASDGVGQQKIIDSSINNSVDRVRHHSNSLSDLAAPVESRGKESDEVVSQHRSGVASKNTDSSEKSKELAPDHIKKIAAWERQSKALNAPAYRITVVPRQDKDKKTFNIGKQKDGNEKFFTANDVKDLIPQLRRQNAIGNDIYITPIDTENHYFVLDDTKQENIDILKNKGVVPVLVQKSSENNYQAIFKAPRDMSFKGEQSLANTLVMELNKKHGDQKFSGVIHPFRMAGFSNAKPGKGRAFTQVVETNKETSTDKNQLHKMMSILKEGVIKTTLSTEKNKRLQHLSDKDVDSKIKDMSTNYIKESRHDNNFSLDNTETYLSYHKAYRAAFNKQVGLVNKMGWTLDLSKVDYQCSIEMLKNGFESRQIEQAIVDISPSLYDRHNNETDYARRTVEAAVRSPEVQKHYKRQAERSRDRSQGFEM